MDIKIIFRIDFWILFGGLIVMQIYFSSRVYQAGERVAANRQAIEREGWVYIIVRIIGSLALIGFLVLYAFNPAWMEVLSVPFPTWVRWVPSGKSPSSSETNVELHQR